ncbi:MAG: YceI family protein [Actinomycetota bacterium]
MPVPALLRQRRTWLIAIPVLVLLVAVVGPWVYINVLRDDPPERLTLADATTTTAASGDATSTTEAGAAGGIEGTWVVGEGSVAGYRVKEVLFGQDAEAVGRTSEVTGSLEMAGTTVTAVEVTVDMASVTSDESRRDGQFRGRIMDTATHPTATFVLTEPIELGELPAKGDEVSVAATGELTLRGVTREVSFDITARRGPTSIDVSAAILLDFDDFQIPDASGGPASVGREGELELLLVFTRS